MEQTGRGMAVRIGPSAWNKIGNKDNWLVCMEGWLCTYAHCVKYGTKTVGWCVLYGCVRISCAQN